ncbi:hypothetical protein DFH09DRAFT_1080549 [Mycena vulgaris]|nr:hypothetical protein DFH09DRAFT_1080549 [Mycena vulgaris]
MWGGLDGGGDAEEKDERCEEGSWAEDCEPPLVSGGGPPVGSADGEETGPPVYVWETLNGANELVAFADGDGVTDADAEVDERRVDRLEDAADMVMVLVGSTELVVVVGGVGSVLVVGTHDGEERMNDYRKPTSADGHLHHQKRELITRVYIPWQTSHYLRHAYGTRWSRDAGRGEMGKGGRGRQQQAWGVNVEAKVKWTRLARVLDQRTVARLRQKLHDLTMGLMELMLKQVPIEGRLE